VFEIIEAQSEPELIEIRKLFKEYADWLGFDLSFQNFDKEFAELPGKYAPPDGCLLLAFENSIAVGCVGIRKFETDICEMKRLYVQPAYRGKDYGRELAQQVIDQARKIRYKYMRLDTVPWMNQAIGLYRALGFYEIPAYRHNPIKGALYFELKL